MHSVFVVRFFLLGCFLIGFNFSLVGDDLDVGIYWYGPNGSYQKALPNTPNPYFDKDKPTIIYIHGLNTDAMPDRSHESFLYQENYTHDTINIDTAAIWRKKGWNIGAFYWRQFADEAIVWDAEAKIWSIYGYQGMRQRRVDGSYFVDPNINKTVTQMFYESFVEAMQGYRGNNIRFAGNSLGNQLAITTANMIRINFRSNNLPYNLLPSRIALLDPYYSFGGKHYLNWRWPGEIAREYVRALRDEGVVFEHYGSSLVQHGGDSNIGLRNLSAQQELRPWFIDALDIGAKHTASTKIYFSSFNNSPPKEVKYGAWVGPWYFRYWDPYKKVYTGEYALSASTPDERVDQMMRNDYYWDQVAGRYTFSTHDDEFERKWK